MGRGVHMEPVEADMYAADQASDFPSWEYGVIDSTCRWSVRIVDGPHTVVEQYVPQIPPRG
jgi:hypothetical protein